MRYLTSISKKQQHKVTKSGTDTGYLPSFASVQNSACDSAATWDVWPSCIQVASLKVASPDLPTPVCSFGSGEVVVISLPCVV